MPAWEHTILIGDFNNKSPNWNSGMTNANGRILQVFANARQGITLIGPQHQLTIPAKWGTF